MTDHDHGEEETRFLDFFDSSRLAIGIAFVAIALLTVFSFKLWYDLDKTVRQVEKLLETRLEEAKASDQAAVSRCFSSATQGPALRRILLAIEQESEDPEAKAAAREFRRLNELNSPTIRECRQLAKKLKVAPTQGEEG